MRKAWSGMADLNRRPHRPERCALPGCANPRYWLILSDCPTITIMLEFILVLVGLGLIMLAEEISWHKKILKAENQRKFVHMSVAGFAAFWPWLLGWRLIQVIAVMMTVLAIVNHYSNIFHYLGALKREGYGHIYFPLGILAVSLLTQQKIFFSLAVLHLALADGLAAIIGRTFGRPWQYKVFRQTKTVLGTMTFWFVSLVILGVGLPLANDLVSFNDYVLLLLFLPPFLSMLENLAVFGLDNVVIPTTVILILQLAAR